MTAVQLVYLLSDATGETAEKIVMAALAQFRGKAVRLKRVSNVRSKNQVYEALDEALANSGLVVYTIVNRELAQLVHDECDALGLPSIDLITPLLMRLAEFVGHSPGETPGLLHGINEEYFRRIEAVEFTVRHDDGQETRNLHKADIVLVGVSRTSKTPLSMYLAHRGWKVANVPLVKGIEPPSELFQIEATRVVGLTIDPQRLLEIRTSRLRNLGQDPRAAYADHEEIEEELRHARRLFRQNAWVMVNVSDKAVEETANEVLVRLNLK
ncbi:putative pyruvate, phosphate dikinase regulatory protein [Desulfuromonas versatilis]|uniref:Putative pyruvate, phosphate dikinase regulatory protein n=1 Tax=Desulfuromonas versatilis TaxID=2802975 RepID=A0ABN6DWA8_9BACT|nr:pyruvate, water dikinase regulatory protein [Desulfuromonas versatilis]BCR03514.1 putative pyruvate, phosphate dikinase regulatory protein [Desulfuromonas versatilis]